MTFRPISSLSPLQNSELDWVAEANEPVDDEGAALDAHIQGIQASATPLQHRQAKDALDALLGDLQVNEDQDQAAVQPTASREHADGTDQHHTMHPIPAESPGFDVVGSMPDVSAEELDAMLQPADDPGHTAQEDDDYEAFLKVTGL